MLSEVERRSLQEIERAEAARDPAFVRRLVVGVGPETGRSPARCKRLLVSWLGPVLLAAAAVLLVLGFVLVSPALVLAGGVATVAGACGSAVSAARVARRVTTRKRGRA
jgi:hypothetical protein